MVTGSDLAQAFAAAWSSPGEVDPEVRDRLVALCAAAHRELPELDGAIDDRELVTTLASRAPDREVVAYLERCHPGELALAQAASRAHPAAIARLERDHRGVLDALCWRYASPGHSAADLRQILREKLFIAPAGGRGKLADYAGQGQLDSWLRITAVRVFLDLGRRKDRAREAPTADGELAMPDPGDLSLEVIKAEYRAAVRQALHDAAAELEPADRHLLHQHYVAALSIDQLGVALGIHRATAARRVVRAREALVGMTRALLATRLQLANDDLDEVIGMVLSRLDVSIPRLLEGQRADMTARLLARCPDDNTLGQLVAGELADAERAAVERHLGGCPGCAQLIAEYARATPQRSVPARYRLIRPLGSGAMGEVWEVDDTALGRRIALKFVRPESTADREYQARLVREARALARLHHPNVVAVYDLDQADGELFVALELIDGVSARAWRAAAPRRTADILAVWRKVADGLIAVHRAGIVHRDLKPDNVFVAGDRRVVIGDFGLASVAADGSTTLTATGQIVGTPLYMPLEQLRGGAATARSDQFALCVCLWEALVGTRPFAAGSLAGLIVAMRDPPKLPARHRSLLAVLARGLDPEPDRRWPDVAALIRALDRVRARRRWWLAALAALGVGLAALAIAR